MISMMRLALLCVVATFVGCSNGESERQVNAASETEAVAALENDEGKLDNAAPTEASMGVYQRLPDPALTFDFDVRLKSDKTSTTATGAKRRGVAIACQTASEDNLWSLVEAGFERAGYQRTGGVPSGAESRQYAKMGMPVITVSRSATDDEGDPVIWLGWDI